MMLSKKELQNQAKDRKRQIEMDKELGNKKREQFFDHKNKQARHDIEEQGTYLTH